MQLQLTNSDISALAKMSFIAERDLGQRFKLSQPDSVVSLLRYASESSNDELGALFRDFVGKLESNVQKQLIYRGVAIPAELHRQASVEAAESAQVVKKSRRVYRGQVIEGEDAVTTASDHPAPADTSGETPRRSKRIYRGQVIED